MRSIADQILILLQLLTLFGSLCVMVYGLSKFMAKPHNSLAEEVADIQRWRKTVDERLERGNERFNDQTEANRVTQNALLALVDKEIRDCDLKKQTIPQELTNAKRDLVQYLTGR